MAKTEWQLHLDKYAKEHPELSFKEVLSKAAPSYHSRSNTSSESTPEKPVKKNKTKRKTNKKKGKKGKKSRARRTRSRKFKGGNPPYKDINKKYPEDSINRDKQNDMTGKFPHIEVKK